MAAAASCWRQRRREVHLVAGGTNLNLALPIHQKNLANQKDACWASGGSWGRVIVAPRARCGVPPTEEVDVYAVRRSRRWFLSRLLLRRRRNNLLPPPPHPRRRARQLHHCKTLRRAWSCLRMEESKSRSMNRPPQQELMIPLQQRLMQPERPCGGSLRATLLCCPSQAASLRQPAAGSSRTPPVRRRQEENSSHQRQPP